MALVLPPIAQLGRATRAAAYRSLLGDPLTLRCSSEFAAIGSVASLVLMSSASTFRKGRQSIKSI
eukprot:8568118-Heterocapsa_arctica.AAC.1